MPYSGFNRSCRHNHLAYAYISSASSPDRRCHADSRRPYYEKLTALSHSCTPSSWQPSWQCIRGEPTGNEASLFHPPCCARGSKCHQLRQPRRWRSACLDCERHGAGQGMWAVIKMLTLTSAALAIRPTHICVRWASQRDKGCPQASD